VTKVAGLKDSFERTVVENPDVLIEWNDGYARDI
jgi:hypothetical protein